MSSLGHRGCLLTPPPLCESLSRGYSHGVQLSLDSWEQVVGKHALQSQVQTHSVGKEGW